jgi:hypothetical protein
VDFLTKFLPILGKDDTYEGEGAGSEEEVVKPSNYVSIPVLLEFA